jgi:hypothetical protein
MPTIRPRISVNLPEAEYAELSEMAKKNNLSMAWIGAKAIHVFLDHYRDKQLPLAFAESVGSPTGNTEPPPEPR